MKKDNQVGTFILSVLTGKTFVQVLLLGAGTGGAVACSETNSLMIYI